MNAITANKIRSAVESIEGHRIVSRDEWLTERRRLLAREKELTHLSDQIAAERQALPWVRVDKGYVFDTLDGKRSLADLFDGRHQLLIQHFMLAPGCEQGCPSCYMADHNDGMIVPLAHRDVTFMAVPRGDQERPVGCGAVEGASTSPMACPTTRCGRSSAGGDPVPASPEDAATARPSYARVLEDAHPYPRPAPR